jgi:hypothetical protein
LLPEQPELTEFGYVGDIAITRPEEAPDVVIVRAAISVPCGTEDDVYIYDYSGFGRRTVLESPGNFMNASNVSISRTDSAGNRLILINRLGVQCESTYYGMNIELFHWSVASNQASRVLATQHGFWLSPDEPPVRLTPNELLLELTGNRIDTERRTHVLRYRVAPASAERIDPVALQPHDFVDEWLTRPWNEMESRSVGRDLKKWHEFLHGEYIHGQFAFSQSCSEETDQWLIGLTVDTLQGKEIPEPLSLFFTVHALPEHSYRMAGISFVRSEGCPGNAPVNEEMPSLFSVTSKK